MGIVIPVLRKEHTELKNRYKTMMISVRGIFVVKYKRKIHSCGVLKSTPYANRTPNDVKFEQNDAYESGNMRLFSC